MKQKLLRIFMLLSVLAISTQTMAQVNYDPVVSQFKLEARADFDYDQNTLNGVPVDQPFGFHGRYFNILMGGNIGDKFSYFFRQRVKAEPGTISLFDNTDFLYVTYSPTQNWNFRLGKDALAVGGFEYDAPPIDVLFSTNYWDNFYCFQPGASVVYKTNDANQMFIAQVASSPYIYYGAKYGYPLGQEWESGLLSWNLYYSATFGHLKLLHSVNMFQRPDRGFMNYIALGHKLVYKHWDMYLDLMHHANATNDWGKNFALVSCANWYFDNGLSLFAKGAYEQNRSNESIPGFGFGDNIDLGLYDIFVDAGTSYCTYGIGAEFRPVSYRDVRLHAFLANRCTTFTPDEAQIAEGMAKTVANNIQFNVGVTWDMNIYNMLKKRAKENSAL